jgi:endoglucanase
MRRSYVGLGGVGLAVISIAAACGGGGGNEGPGNGPDASIDGATIDGAPAEGAASGDDGPVVKNDGAPGSPDGSPSSDDTSEAGEAGVSDLTEAGAPSPPLIVVDQFGYRTTAEKIAVLRNPQKGFDSSGTVTVGAMYAVVDSASGTKVFEAAPAAWAGGIIDTPSGDKAAWFDFSSVTTPGKYYVLNESDNTRSDVFTIADDVYRTVLTQAVRMLYYQRDGIAHTAANAGSDYADGVGDPQDEACGLYSDGSAQKDLHGGWFDAGDQSKYTNFASSDVIHLLRAYTERPTIFTDDYNIPESQNSVPDILDEAKWALDWLGRMQNADGSVLSIVANPGGSPPSSAVGACKYGPATTSASFSAAAAFAFASKVFSTGPAATTYPGYAAALATQAASAWTWATSNAVTTFFNESPGGTQSAIGSREQELDAAHRQYKAVQAAAFLFELTGTAQYQTYFDANYTMLPTALDPQQMETTETLLEYAKTANATPAVASAILSAFGTNVSGATFLGAQQSNSDPYMAPLATYLFPSNAAKAGQGNMFYDVSTFGAPLASTADASVGTDMPRYAERYVHYLHGVNPIGIVYLSSMNAFGATRSVDRVWVGWFGPTSIWSAAGVTKYGPAPGFLVPGPNPQYNWESCCATNSCGVGCGLPAAPAPPYGQPDEKSYRDMNDSWPLDSWLVSEPNDGYQAQYIRLLSKFVN